MALRVAVTAYNTASAYQPDHTSRCLTLGTSALEHNGNYVKGFGQTFCPITNYMDNRCRDDGLSQPPLLSFRIIGCIIENFPQNVNSSSSLYSSCYFCFWKVPPGADPIVRYSQAPPPFRSQVQHHFLRCLGLYSNHQIYMEAVVVSTSTRRGPHVGHFAIRPGLRLQHIRSFC